jgi:tRNA(adenine34) deaminase
MQPIMASTGRQSHHPFFTIGAHPEMDGHYLHLQYVEDLRRGFNADIERKDFLGVASIQPALASAPQILYEALGLPILAERTMENDPRHTAFMRLALEEARRAADLAEVPVGAVLISAEGEVLARAHNRVILDHDPSAHAEMLAIRQAAVQRRNYRLLNTTLYVTVEPCLMCMGAAIHARIAKLVFGTRDPKWGAAGSLYNLGEDRRLNHHTEIVEGLLLEECRDLIQGFFRARRPG